MKPFLILQLRGNDLAAQDEFDAFLKYGNLSTDDVVRVRMEADDLPEVSIDDYSGIIVGGGPWNVSDADEKKTDKQHEAEAWLSALLDRIMQADSPYLGACYGFGMAATFRGATVSKERYGEGVEATTIHLRPEAQEDPLLQGIPEIFPAFAGHKESCQDLPEDAVWLASSEACPYHMFRWGQNVYATQFHPELDIPVIRNRIDIYKNAGYFPPEEAEPLKELASKQEITVPMEILRRFVEKYRR